jgi:hypothetical protein
VRDAQRSPVLLVSSTPVWREGGQAGRELARRACVCVCMCAGESRSADAGWSHRGHRSLLSISIAVSCAPLSSRAKPPAKTLLCRRNPPSTRATHNASPPLCSNRPRNVACGGCHGSGPRPAFISFCCCPVLDSGRSRASFCADEIALRVSGSLIWFPPCAATASPRRRALDPPARPCDVCSSSRRVWRTPSANGDKHQRRRPPHQLCNQCSPGLCVSSRSCTGLVLVRRSLHPAGRTQTWSLAGCICFAALVRRQMATNSTRWLPAHQRSSSSGRLPAFTPACDSASHAFSSALLRRRRWLLDCPNAVAARSPFSACRDTR